MELADIMPEINAEAMRSQIVDVEKHPYAAQLLLTILLHVKKAYQAKSTSLAVANIRGMTQERIDRARHNDPDMNALFLEQYEIAFDENLNPIYDGNRRAINPRRWKPAVFLLAIRNLCEIELTRRGFQWELIPKKKKRKWENEEEGLPAQYWVLKLAWA